MALCPPEGTAEERREFALEHLATLLDIHARGLREPLPIACKASAAYARATDAKNVLSNIASTKLKIAVLAPMPMASVRTATAVKPGL